MQVKVDIAPIWRRVLAILSVGAAVIHFAVISHHFGESAVYGALFLVSAWAQVVWAVMVVWRPSRLWLLLGAVGNAAVLAGYVWTRTSGWPFGPDIGEAEEVGGLDVTCSVLELGIVVGVVVLLLRPSWGGRRMPVVRARLLTVGVGVAVVLACSLVFTPALAGPEGPGGHMTDDEMATGPITSVEDPRLTPAQAAAAQKLIDETRIDTQGLSTVVAAEAAGYTQPLNALHDSKPGTKAGSSPSDKGESVSGAVQATAKKGGGYLHLLNPAYMHDGRQVDPAHVESLMFQVSPDGDARLVSAMYILEPGTTMGNAPDIAGELTMWHDWRGHMSTQVQSKLPAAAQHQASKFPPMLHVWVVDNQCGPFAGMEAGNDGKGHIRCGSM